MNKTAFRPRDTWSAVSHTWADFQGGNTSAPLWLRIWLKALARADVDGHASFPHGVATEVLVASRATGELREPSRQGVGKALTRLRTEGWVTHDSTDRCVRISLNTANNSIRDRRGKACEVHGG